MNISVTSAAPQRVTVAQPKQSVSVNVETVEVDATARTVQPELAGYWLETNIEGNPDNFTIWFEDGK